MDLRRMACVLCVVVSGCMQGYQPMAGSGDEVPAAQSALTVYDPFVGEQPSVILEARQQQLNGKLLGIPIQRELFELGQTDLKDPRPWLLLARDSMARDWVGFAMRQYGSALAADRRVIRTEGVLEDVLDTAIIYTGVEESDANAMLMEYWGVAALPAITEALDEMEATGRDLAADKLTVMRDAILAAAEPHTES
jgi:hypothetical protein